MGAYNESLIKAGVLLAGEGLADAKEGFVVDFDSTPPVVTDGPYAEAKELFNGFWILEVSSKEEAAEWAKRCPLGPGTRGSRCVASTSSRTSRRTTSGSRRSRLARRGRGPVGGRARMTGPVDPSEGASPTETPQGLRWRGSAEKPAEDGDADRARRAVAAVWRIESARIVATLTRFVGDVGQAEDLAQEAMLERCASGRSRASRATAVPG